jgi:hypothetical protein
LQQQTPRHRIGHRPVDQPEEIEMDASNIRRILAAFGLAGALAAANPAAAQDALTFSACDATGASTLEARLEYANVPEAQDLVHAWQTLFCGRTPLKRAVQRVGFPFTESFAGFHYASDREDRNRLDRTAFLQNYAYLDASAHDSAMVELVTGIDYTTGATIVAIGFEGDAGRGLREFRQYRGKWIWIGEKHVIAGDDEDEPGC